MSIKPGEQEAKQGYSWIFNEKGLYSVKSGYRPWESLDHLHHGQVPEQSPNYSIIYNQIWHTDTSPKLRHFLWRCLTSSLAIGNEMKKRTLTHDDFCSICGQATETTFHLFFDCAFSRLMWIQSPYAHILSDISCSTHGKIYTCSEISGSLEVEYQDLWTWILWRIWKVRNELVYQGTIPDALHAYNLALVDAHEWREHGFHKQSITYNTNEAHPDVNVTRWQPPPLHVIKCNMGATWQDDHGRCVASWILRRSTGDVVFWGIKTFPKLLYPLDAEASALVWAMTCMRNMGYDNIIFETDSSSLIEAVHNPASRPRLLNYSSKIQGMITQNNWQVSFMKVKRQGNMAADSLATYANDFPLYYGFIDNKILLWLTPSLDMNI